jgi:hypothetical protein
MPGKRTWVLGLVLLVGILAIVVHTWTRHSGVHRQVATTTVLKPAPPAASSAAQAPIATVSNAVETYQNARFDFTVDYPGQLLVAGQEADNGDGLRFAPIAGDADIRAWGEYNANEDSPAGLLKFDLDNDCAKDKVSYQVSKPDLVAYSCLNTRGRVVYEKVIIRDDTLATVRFEYAASEQATWAPVIKQMAASLSLGPEPTYEEAR